MLDAVSHWFRFEYQARGSIHSHRCVKLKNDPDIPTLKTCGAKAWSLLETQSDMENFEFFFHPTIDDGKESEVSVKVRTGWGNTRNISLIWHYKIRYTLYFVTFFVVGILIGFSQPLMRSCQMNNG